MKIGALSSEFIDFNGDRPTRGHIEWLLLLLSICRRVSTVTLDHTNKLKGGTLVTDGATSSKPNLSGLDSF